jgi:carboxymethylenebutenolidase
MSTSNFSSSKNLTAAQQKLVNLWEEHTHSEFADKSVDKTMSTMIEGAYVHNVPTLTGGLGLAKVRHFYAQTFLPHLPPDTATTLISRTVGENQIVDELIFKFTHTIAMEWMLPGVLPTGKAVEIALVAIVGFKEDRICHEHIYWDQASVLVQLGLLDPTRLPVKGIESAREVWALSNAR